MAPRVRRWLLAGQRRAGPGGGGSVFGDPGFDSVGGQPTAVTGGEEGLAGCAATFGEPVTKDGDAGGGERGAAFLSALAFAADVRAGSEVDVGAGQVCQFGHP